MKIRRLRIEGFRAFEQATLHLENLTALIGRNGTGKSTLLHALHCLFDPGHVLEHDDVCQIGATPSTQKDTLVEIEAVFDELTEEETEEFKPYLSSQCLSVVKVYQEVGHPGRYYGNTKSHPDFGAIRAIEDKRIRAAEFNRLVESGRFPALRKVRGAPEADALMDQYEKEHPDECTRTVRRAEQFFGSRNVGGGKLDKFTDFVLVPAVRDVAQDLTGKRSAIDSLVQMIVLRRVQDRADIRKAKEDVQQIISTSLRAENLPELSILECSLNEIFSHYCPDAKLHLDWPSVPT